MPYPVLRLVFLSDVTPRNTCNIKAYIKAPIFWDMKPCRLVYMKCIVGEASYTNVSSKSLDYPEDGGNELLRNLGLLYQYNVLDLSAPQ